VTIPFKTERPAPDSTYEIQCTVRDASRRVVEATAGVPVYAALLRLGLRTELLLAPLGTVIPLAVRAADLDGRPAAAAVTLSLRQPVWVEKEGRYRYRALTETRVSVPAAGSAAATVPAAAQGELQVVAAARDSTGRTASAILSLWVAGPEAKPARETREPQLTVRLDRRTYRPGDTARAWVSSNTRAKPILVTVEGADVWQYQVMPAGGSFLWPLKTRRSMSPNASVSACQWVRGNLLLDEAVLPLPDPSQQISVRIEPDQARYRPGDPARYLIRTRDGRGRPVSAEVAIAVVDEAIFAVRPDTTPDLFTAFWGRRPNLTRTTFSAPEELSGGAYQRTQAPAPVREQFLDTAYWAPRVMTGADGTARVSFAFPGNLTAWRATARAVTAETRVGAATAQVEVSRPVMLRLAVPRQVVQGDRLILAGTVHNRTEQEREFEAKLAAEGVRIEGEPVRRVHVAAGAEGNVEWTLSVDALPADGAARLQGEVVAVDAPPDRRAEFADALRVGLRIAPRGIAERIAVGGALARERSLDLALPADRIEPATSVTITVRAGLRQAVQDGARRVLAAGRHGSLGAANHLLVSVAADGADSRAQRDALALLSRFQQGSGAWGWWETDPPDPVITARVLTSLAAARAAGVPVPETLLERGTAGAVGLYVQTNLWEYRALMAAAITLAGPRAEGDARRAALGARGQQLLEEVQRRGTHLSPYARCLLAQALLQSGDRQAASAIAEEIARSAAIGPEVAYLPAGEYPGWAATAAETTAQGLILLTRLSQEPELQRKLAEWLARPEEERSQDEEALATYALWGYSRMHPGPIQRGEVEVSVNGVPLEAPRPPEDQPLRVEVPRPVLHDGANRVALRRAGEGEVFVRVEARCFRPAHGEADAGIRVLRRLEARNGLGIWEEVRAPLPPAVILRATVVVWPRDGADAIRVTEPIPAGAELIDSEAEACAREEVRDGAVVHYLRGAGQPVSFRYYLRPESGGSVIALPAVAEAVRRPAVRGTSAAAGLEVEP
jgi:uncharacterized protein YfaS (alpha-2-macroglobulin family)